MLLKAQIGHPGHTVPSSNVKYPISVLIQLSGNTHCKTGQRIRAGVVEVHIGHPRHSVPLNEKRIIKQIMILI